MAEFTLDDAVTLLLQLEPEDRDEFARVREALADLAFGNKVPIAIQPVVAKAVRVLKPLAEGTAPDPAAAFAEVCALLEQAMDGDGATPAPAPAAAAAPAPRPAPVAVAPAAAPVAAGVDPADVLPADVDLELLRDFLVESRDCITGSEAALLALEHTPDDMEAVNTVFRAFHTVKGTSAFIGLARMCAFAHEAESLLSRVRDRDIAYTSACATLSLRSVDMLKALLDAVEETLHASGPGGSLELPEGYQALIDALVGYDGSAAAPLAPVSVAAQDAAIASTADDNFFAERTTDERRQGDRRQGADRRQADRRSGNEADQFLRVRTDRLDRLIDMVGELVIAQSMISGDETLGAARDGAASGTHHELNKKITHAGKIVRELQDLSMSMRMVPLKATFQKLTRLVRDVTAKLGKDVEFSTEGEDTEIDRNMVDVVGDPLVHMVRNALDHGVETPEERLRVGKPRQGRVTLSAYQAGGSVIVELRDDGRGLNRERIVRKAIEKGLIDSDRGMTDGEVFQLIFAPGFSTAEKITDVSGRGVGMDVVKRNIESVRGRVEIASTPGQGTTFYVRLPLTLAVTDGMLVRVGAERYVVPTTNIHMSFRPERAMLQTIGGSGEVVTLRGEVMPIVRLHRLFNVAGAQQDPTEALLMIVGDGRQRRSALLVDELLGQQQVVAKSLGDGIGTVGGIAGGAILGDGRVGLILDVGDIVALAQSGEASTPVEVRRAVA
jgi:two-component system chemotaxis sensor kinase CheA